MFTTTSHPQHATLSLLDLPRELHIELLSFLDFRDLQMLRATNTYFRDLPSDTEIARIRAASVAVLHNQELEEYSNTSDSEAFNYLNCYCCLRRRHIHHFTTTQTSRRRRKGHADCLKRFCADCALAKNKWEPGIMLTFNYGMVVYCRGCRKLKPPPVAEKSRILGLCAECRRLAGIPHPNVDPVFEPTHSFWYSAKDVVDRAFAELHDSGRPVTENTWASLSRQISALKLEGQLGNAVEEIQWSPLLNLRGERE